MSDTQSQPQPAQPTVRCSTCGAPASVKDDRVVRTCSHASAVIADMQAVAYGESKMN